MPLLVAALLTAIGSSMLIAPAQSPEKPAPRYAQTIKVVPTSRKLIAFTFDDGPNRRYTPKVLSLLMSHHAHATFFVIGQEVIRFPDVVQSLVRANMEIGNHGMHHRWLRRLPAEAVRLEATGGADAIIAAGGPKPYLYRLPAALSDQTTRKVLGDLHYTIVSWSVDTRDWRRGVSAERIAKTVLRDAAPGKIVIMHDGSAYRDKTLRALKTVLPELERRGYQIVTVGDLLRNSQFEAQRAIPPAPARAARSHAKTSAAKRPTMPHGILRGLWPKKTG